jgi:putative phosphotransacetylase
MTDPRLSDDELERLAALIAETLLRHRESSAATPTRDNWLPTPVRPESAPRSSEPPVWSGAGQSLDGIAPGTSRSASAGRAIPIAELSDAARAAAAGKGPPPTTAPTGRVPRTSGPRGRRAKSIEMAIGVSNRHIHLSEKDARALFGGGITMGRPISQPGQFAAAETVVVEGPKGKLEGVRVVGPVRPETQVEISLTDARRLGLDVPIAASGSLATSVGGVTLRGTAGTVRLERGVIVASRHLHLSADDARAWGLASGDLLDVRCGKGSRAITFHGVLVRAGTTNATELHLDADEANAAAIRTGDRATILAWKSVAAKARRLITERDVIELARRGESIPAGALLTPSALDRARALALRQS